MAVVRNLIIRGGADFSSLRNEMRRAQKNVSEFKSGVQGAFGKIGMVLGGLSLMNFGSDAIRSAMDVEAAMQQIQRLMGSSAQDFKEWSDSQASAFNMSSANAIKYGAIFGNLLSTFSSGAEDTKNKTIDILKASSIIASSTGRTMDDVMWRIRSGLLGNTEAIEDLGVNVYVNLLKTTQAFRQFAGDKSWDQLDFQTQQLIRYYGILEQVNMKFGTTINQNTNSALQGFQAALGNVKLALGRAFLPIMNVILPILTRFMNALATVLGYVAQFMAALFGYEIPAIKAGAATSAAAEGAENMGDAMDTAGKKATGAGKKTKKAANEIKKALRGVAGFDQLNLLPDPNKDKNDSTPDTGSGGAGGGGGGGGGGGISTPKMPDILPGNVWNGVSDKIKKMAENFKKWIQPAINVIKKAWGAVVDFIKEKGKQIKQFWEENGGQFKEAMSNVWNFLKPILKWLVKFLWESIKGAIDGIIQVFEGIIEFISGVFTGDWSKAWEGLKDIFFGLIKAIWNIMNLMFFKSLITGLGKFIFKFGEGFISIVKNIKKPFDGIEKWFAKSAEKIWDAIKGKFKDVETWFKDNVVTKIKTVIENGKTAIGTAAGKVWSGIKGAFSTAYTWMRDNVAYKIRDAFVNTKDAIANKASAVWTAIKGKFTKVYDWYRDKVVTPLKSALESWKDRIAGAASAIWTGIKSKFTSVYNWYRDQVVVPLKSALESWKTAIANKAGEIWSAIKGKFTSVYNWFRDNVASPISKALSNIGSGMKDGITSGVKGALNKFIGFFNSAIGAFNGFKGKLPFGLGDSIPNIPKIPKLAQGGYIGANKPLLAMIGDNRNEGEIVAPESKIYAQTYKAIKDAMGAGGGTELTINFGSSTVFRKIIEGINKAQRQAGKTLIEI